MGDNGEGAKDRGAWAKGINRDDWEGGEMTPEQIKQWKKDLAENNMYDCHGEMFIKEIEALQEQKKILVNTLRQMYYAGELPDNYDNWVITALNKAGESTP